MLRSHREYIDEAIIIDDGSHDGSGELCRELLKGIPLRVVRNETASFTNEVELRKQQWRETLASSRMSGVCIVLGLFEKNIRTNGMRNEVYTDLSYCLS